jgi:hypothetical protein
MGGSLHTLPAQAIVMRFGFQSCVPPQLTKTTGPGHSTFPGFQDCFLMRSLFTRYDFLLSAYGQVYAIMVHDFEGVNRRGGRRPVFLSFILIIDF